MKMSVSLSLLSLLSLSIFIHSAYCFDITQILNKNPEFSSFNSYLTQTNLAGAINARQTVTVLAVDNGGISALSSRTPDTIKNILSVHVILDYYDAAKLKQLSTNSPLLTTLFQSTGLAKGQQGFLKVTHPTPDSTAFSSAMPGPTQSSSLVKSVASEPYNISVLQISNAIIPQGIDGTKTSSPQSVNPTSATPTSSAPVPSMAPPTTAASTPTSTPPTPAAPTTASPPTTAAATPATATTASPPTKAATTPTSSTSTAPTAATTPSAAPASGGGAPTPTQAAAPDAAAGDDPAEATPAADEPKKTSAAGAVEIGFTVVCAVALSMSTLYLTSSV